MPHRLRLLPHLSLALLLAACPGGKATTEGDSATATDTDTATTTTGGPVTGDPAVTTSSATQDTDSCQPIPCDGCPDGCIGQSVCNGAQASCVCECEGVTTGDVTGETTSAPLTSTDTGTSAETSTGADTDTGTSDTTGTTGEPAIACGGDEPYFPEFDRSCSEPADCAVVFHQLDCCGSLAGLGISTEVAKDFAEAEAECAAQYPMCDCVAMPTVADDGSSTPDDSAIEVTCLDGQCISYLP